MSVEKEKNVVIPPLSEIENERQRMKRGKSFRKAVLSTLYALVIVAALAALIASLILPVMQISGDSMDPTLHEGDTVVLLKATRYKAGDLCSFSWNNKTLIKRIIAVAGDKIEIDPNGNVKVNDKIIDEPYIQEKGLGECDIKFPYFVPDNSYFVMGDHRATSIDSRSTVIGSVNHDQIIGKVFIRVLPFNRFGFVK